MKLWSDRLGQPQRWQRPRMIFVCSMADLFHELVPDAFIAEVFAVMAIAQRHTYQVLTKRPERMRDLLKSWRFCKLVMAAIAVRGREIPNSFIVAEQVYEGFDALSNVWVGTTIENRRFVHRADLLRETPAAVRFVSAEPLLGRLLHDDACYDGLDRVTGEGTLTYWADGFAGPHLDLGGIDWLIAGGESGPGARPCREDWLRDLRDACEQSGTAFFLKQLGTRLARERGVKGKGGGDLALLDGRRHTAMPTMEVAHA